MALLSVIIPSKSERFLRQTVEDALKHASQEIEVICALDGAWPVEELPDDPRIRILHFGAARGMRACINAAVGVSRGEYLMKSDAHIKFSEGFDEVLKANCADDWVVIPRRKRLDAENWDIQDVHKPDVDYEYLSYPLWKEDAEPGLHGTIWTQRIRERFGKPEYEIDDNPSFQGSCYFLTRKHWDRIGGMPEEGYYGFQGEPQQIGMKTWLSGGRVVINKLAHVAHLHKGSKYGRMYSVNRDEIKAGNTFSTRFWMGDKWSEAKYTMEWFINDKFPDMPYWPSDWREKWNEYERANYPQNGQAIKVNGHTPAPLPVKEVTPVSVMPVPPINTLPFLCTRFSVAPDNKQVDLPISRSDLALLFADLGFTRGAEIGVERGLYSEVLCQSIPGLQLSSIDMWQTYPEYREHVHQDKLDRFYAEAQTRLAGYNTQLIKAFSVDASRQFEDGSLDFVYIDAAHDFLNVTQDIYHWSRKVRIGGIVAGHDFKREKNDRYTNHVKDVVQAWTYSHSIRPLFIVRGDHSPSWFYVREK